LRSIIDDALLEPAQSTPDYQYRYIAGEPAPV
jgi:hypothetical protein